MEHKNVSQTTLCRLPAYLGYLKSLSHNTPANISATALASALDLGEVQVRKDLASISNGGKPKTGYLVQDLINELETFLGYRNVDNAIIIGAGKLGIALLNYEGFQEYGLKIVAAFDIDEKVVETPQSLGKIFPLSKFNDLSKRLNIHIGIITVPADNAQNVCDLMVQSGILAIMNFAPTHLKVPDHILLQNMNIATSLAVLSKNLMDKIGEQAT